jgi:hypothetical protein
MIKKGAVFGFMIALILFSINVMATSSISTPSVCCEKMTEGAFCINTQQEKCDSEFQIVSTSCESTSFCKLGTCYDSKEGMCLENVPQRVCQSNNGSWSEKKASELAQCSLGCCILADQAAFVTQTRCKSLSTFYGIGLDFRPSVSSEQACIEIANSQDEGACVFYESSVKTCKFTTRKECGGVSSTVSLNASPLEDTSGKRFYKDVLCSNEALGTVNARQVKTGCYEGKVYWFDSEGQRENVYSSNSEKSWNKGRVADPDEICAESSDSKTCGNCDYLLGSRCSDWTSAFSLITKPSKVNHYCKTTKCTDRDGKERMNGESWCVYDGKVGDGRDVAGSRQFREICVDGKVQVEACEDFRNQICIHSGISTSQGEYSVAACRVNRWQDCTSQVKKDNCENTDQRDCIWIAPVDGINFTKSSSSQTSSQITTPNSSIATPNSKTASSSSSTIGQVTQLGSKVQDTAGMFSSGNAIKHVVGSGVSQKWAENELGNKLRTIRTENDSGLCVPMVPPGLEFWSQGDATAVCSQATANCQVTIRTEEKFKSVLLGALGGKEKEYTMYETIWDENEEQYINVPVEETDCLQWENKDKGELKVNPDWGASANAICSAMGDCGADLNINGKFTDDGYEWKFNNESFFFTAADLGLLTRGLGKGTGEVIAIDYIINDKYKLNEDDYVYVKQ